MSQGHGAGGIVPTRPERSVWPPMRCERLTSTVELNVGGATPRNLVSTTDWGAVASATDQWQSPWHSKKALRGRQERTWSAVASAVVRLADSIGTTPGLKWSSMAR